MTAQRAPAGTKFEVADQSYTVLSVECEQDIKLACEWFQAVAAAWRERQLSDWANAVALDLANEWLRSKHPGELGAYAGQPWQIAHVRQDVIAQLVERGLLAAGGRVPL